MLQLKWNTLSKNVLSFSALISLIVICDGQQRGGGWRRENNGNNGAPQTQFSNQYGRGVQLGQFSYSRNTWDAWQPRSQQNRYWDSQPAMRMMQITRPLPDYSNARMDKVSSASSSSGASENIALRIPSNVGASTRYQQYNAAFPSSGASLRVANPSISYSPRSGMSYGASASPQQRTIRYEPNILPGANRNPDPDLLRVMVTPTTLPTAASTIRTSSTAAVTTTAVAATTTDSVDEKLVLEGCVSLTREQFSKIQEIGFTVKTGACFRLID